MDTRIAPFRFHCGLCGDLIRKGDLCQSIENGKLICTSCPDKLLPKKERRLKLVKVREKK